VGEKGLAAGTVEMKTRRTGEKIKLAPADVARSLQELSRSFRPSTD
jgi:hypothetical protein